MNATKASKSVPMVPIASVARIAWPSVAARALQTTQQPALESNGSTPSNGWMNSCRRCRRPCSRRCHRRQRCCDCCDSVDSADSVNSVNAANSADAAYVSDAWPLRVMSSRLPSLSTISTLSSLPLSPRITGHSRHSRHNRQIYTLKSTQQNMQQHRSNGKWSKMEYHHRDNCTVQSLQSLPSLQSSNFLHFLHFPPILQIRTQIRSWSSQIRTPIRTWSSTTINQQSQQYHQSKQSKRKSPFAILQVGANASRQEIKAAFRKLAKQHHPDMTRQNQPPKDNHHERQNDDEIMSELIHAYESLMNKRDEFHLWDNDDSASGRDSRVALACEMYSMEELKRMKGWYDVYSFRVEFCYDDKGNGGGNEGNWNDPSDNGDRAVASVASVDSAAGTTQSTPTNDNDNQHHALDPSPLIPLKIHPDDSISDIKRHIQNQFASSWGLEGRRVDRDGVFLGWELVYCNGDKGSSEGSEGSDIQGGDREELIIDVSGDGQVLSYHLFLHNYGIGDGDVLYAVVCKNE